MRRGNPAIGAIASFIGLVRDVNDGDSVGGMTLEHYPGMTEKALEKIVAEAQSRWDVIDVLVVHRVGALRPTDQIVLVAVTSAHRGEAFAACEFVMDYWRTRGAILGKRADRARASMGRSQSKRTTQLRSLELAICSRRYNASAARRCRRAADALSVARPMAMCWARPKLCR